ncbi:MAG: glycerol kinase GlpK [Myxococcales bacterium]|jgi:glycerol kinase|nr:glycerol kinase GlpK [Myxococcales bacterium]
MEKFILAIDQGTTGTTCLILDKALQVRARCSQEIHQIFPKPGWVEHDLEEIWATVAKLVPRTLDQAGIRANDLAAIGITNQRETTALWRRSDGQPLHNAIVWQCRRTSDACERLRSEGKARLVRNRTGLVLDPYFSATKLAWLLDNVPGARRDAERGELAFGTIDTFLLWRLTGGAVHATDASNAARTLLFNIRHCAWDGALLELFGIPASGLLPEVRASSEIYGETRGLSFLPDGLPIAGIAGDQQAALFGQACFNQGEAKCTFGTGAFLLMNIGPKPLTSTFGLLTTVAWKIGDEVTYAFEGSAFIAGAAVQWLRDGLGIIETAAQSEALARTVEDAGEVIFVPALTGLGAPHWRVSARGLLAGLSRDTTKGHLARAVLEGIDFQVHDLIAAMEADSKTSLPRLMVDGGASANGLLMQFLADLIDVPVIRPKMIETTAFGAAFLAGLAVGLWNDKAAIREAWERDACFEPSMAAADREVRLARWRKALRQA